MTTGWRLLVVIAFLAGILLSGLVGTSTSMTFVWVPYAVLGLAAVLSIGLLFENVSFTLPRWGTLAVFGLALYLLIRASDSPVAYFAREDAALVIAAFLAYCLFLSLLTATEWRQRLVEVLALLVVIHLAFAFAQAFYRPSLWLIPGYERTITGHPGGLFNQPDHFAAFLASLFPLWIAAAAFGRRGRRIRIAFAILAILSLVGVLLSGSASGIVGILAGSTALAALCGLIAWKRFPKSTRRKLVASFAVAGVIGAILLLANSAPASKAIDRELLTRDGGAHVVALWSTGAKQFLEAPLTGTGSRTSRIHGRLHRSEPFDAAHGEPEFIHNEYLQMLADYGLVGLALALLAIVPHVFSGYRFVRAYSGFGTRQGACFPKSDHLSLVLGALGGLASMAVVATVDLVFHLPVFVLTAAIFLAVLAAPDPMGSALKPAPSSRLIPGGSLLFMNRAVAFGCGIATLLFGLLFSRSEYHYEMARLAFESDPGGFHHHRHLQSARSLDPKNPFAFSLSAHAQVAAILPEMPEPARRQALEQADSYFDKARDLYPQDIFAAVGHAAVLEELGLREMALDRIRGARELAPNYGNLMIAEAELHLRHGRIAEAEKAYAGAMNARAFTDTAAAMRGLRTVTEWKLIAEQNGIDWKSKDPDEIESAPLLARPGERSLPAAKVEERAPAAALPPSDDLDAILSLPALPRFDPDDFPEDLPSENSDPPL